MTSIETETGPAIGQLQTDTFCEGCGYNLHAQVVTRDQRLNLLVCRCPECGRFAAAGQGTTIGRVWLNRFGTLLLVVWIMFLFFGFGLATMFMGMLPYSHLREFTHYGQVHELDPHNKQMGLRNCYLLGRNYYQNGANEGLAEEEIRSQRLFVIWIAAISGVLAFLVGLFHSVFFWHVKGGRRLRALFFPLVGFAGAATFWLMDYMSRYLHGWGMSRLAGYWLLECVCVLAGLAMGRRIARAMLRWFVPPRLRQHLAFLWTTDGRKLRV